MEITIFDGKVMTGEQLAKLWSRKFGTIESMSRVARKPEPGSPDRDGSVVIEISDEDARDLIDELDRLGMNYEA